MKIEKSKILGVFKIIKVKITKFQKDIYDKNNKFTRSNRPLFKITNNALVDIPQTCNIHQKTLRHKSVMRLNNEISKMTYN